MVEIVLFENVGGYSVNYIHEKFSGISGPPDNESCIFQNSVHFPFTPKYW